MLMELRNIYVSLLGPLQFETVVLCNLQHTLDPIGDKEHSNIKLVIPWHACAARNAVIIWSVVH